MKTHNLIFFGAMAISSLMACSSNSSDNANADSLNTDSANAMNVSEASYVNLKTGEPVTIVKDSEKGYYVYSDTKNPIEDDLFFVDVNTKDTLYGKAGVVVNSAIIKSDAGSYMLDESKIERNGDEIKLKIDGDKMKYKDGEDKVKVDGDESKTKTSDTKVKVDN